MKNSRFWRERTLEEEKERLNKIKRTLVFTKIDSDSEIEKDYQRLSRLYKSLGLKPPIQFELRKKARRLARKIRRIEKGIYRQRNLDR